MDICCFWHSPGSNWTEVGDNQPDYEVSGELAVVELCSSAQRVSDRFQGKKDSGWSGALPPAAAQASKYQRSHVLGLIFQRARVAKIENIIIAKRPAHSDPEP